MIISAAKLSAAEQKVATSLAESRLGATGKPELKTDPSLLAGAKIIVGSSLLDLSLAGRLDRILQSIS